MKEHGAFESVLMRVRRCHSNVTFIARERTLWPSLLPYQYT